MKPTRTHEVSAVLNLKREQLNSLMWIWFVWYLCLMSKVAQQHQCSFTYIVHIWIAILRVCCFQNLGFSFCLYEGWSKSKKTVFVIPIFLVHVFVYIYSAFICNLLKRKSNSSLSNCCYGNAWLGIHCMSNSGFYQWINFNQICEVHLCP